MDKKTLFISYCWKDGGSYADDLEKQLSERFDVKRDKSQIGLRDDIQEFMREIANCDSVILIITEGYVVSENCMIEMAYLLEQVDWKEKAWFLVVDSSLYSIEKKIDIIKFWNNKQEMLSNNSDINNQTINDYQKKYESINNILPKFFDGLSRINNPSQISIVNSVIKYSEQNKNQSLRLISESESKVMEIIKKYGNLKMSDIATNTGLSRAAVHRILGNLISEGKIVKTGSNFGEVYKLPEIT